MSKNIKLLVYVALWKRHELSKRVLNVLKSWKIEGFDIDLFCVISEDGSKKTCEDLGIEYCWTENKPVGKKMNFGLFSLKDKDFDYLMQLGSDDFVHKDIFKLYADSFKNNDPYFGVKEYYAVDEKNKRAQYWKYDVNHPTNHARFIRKDVLEKMAFNIWPDHLNSGLDTNSDVNLIKGGYRCKIYDTKKFPYIVDVKTETNIWTYDELVGGIDCDYEVPLKTIKGCEESLAQLEI